MTLLSVVTYRDLPYIITAVDRRGLLKLERVEAREGGSTHRTVYNVPAGSVEVARERGGAA